MPLIPLYLNEWRKAIYYVTSSNHRLVSTAATSRDLTL